MSDIIVAAAILASLIYLVRSTKKKPGCGGGCDCPAKDIKPATTKP